MQREHLQPRKQLLLILGERGHPNGVLRSRIDLRDLAKVGDVSVRFELRNEGRRECAVGQVTDVEHRKEWMRHELVPLSYRQQEITDLEEFIKSSWLCNASKHKRRETKTIQGLIKALSAETKVDNVLNKKAREYYLKLNELRNVDYWKTFPHLEYLNE